MDTYLILGKIAEYINVVSIDLGHELEDDDFIFLTAHPNFVQVRSK
jgi:hypothetical protein